jgi:hypothetical protein
MGASFPAKIGPPLALAFSALLSATELTAATGEMTLATFLGKYEALRKKGLFALGSPDIAALKAEGEAAGMAYLTRLKADRAAGRPPHSCAPTGGRLSQNEFLKGIQQYPVSSRGGITVKMAVADLMRKKYPCGT